MITITVPNDLPHTTEKVLNALTGYHVRLTYICGDSSEVTIVGFTPDGDLITANLINGFTGPNRSITEIESIRRIVVI